MRNLKVNKLLVLIQNKKYNVEKKIIKYSKIELI